MQINDNGPGIPANKYSLVMERFYRLDTARSTSENGLRLSLVKAVMQLHHTSMSLQDALCGLRVTLLLNRK